MKHIKLFNTPDTKLVNPDPDKIANIFKALGHPTRIKIILMIQNGPKCVCELQPELAIDTSTVSKHLSVLRNADIIESEKKGLNVYYSLKMKCVLTFFGCAG